MKNYTDVLVYQIRNTTNGNIYIGSTIDWMERKRSHLRLLRKGKHNSMLMQKEFLEHGEAMFAFEPLKVVECKGSYSYHALSLVEERELIIQLQPAYNSQKYNGITLRRQHDEFIKRLKEQQSA